MYVLYMICICIYVFLYVKTRLNRYELTHLEQALVRGTEYRVQSTEIVHAQVKPWFRKEFYFHCKCMIMYEVYRYTESIAGLLRVLAALSRPES